MYKFAGLSALCGVLSFIITVLIWYCFTGTFKVFFLLSAIPFMVCWGIAGICACFLAKSIRSLASVTYIIVSVLFAVFSILYGYVLDPSVKAWFIIGLIWCIISSLPSFLLLKYLSFHLLRSSGSVNSKDIEK